MRWQYHGDYCDGDGHHHQPTHKNMITCFFKKFRAARNGPGERFQDTLRVLRGGSNRPARELTFPKTDRWPPDAPRTPPGRPPDAPRTPPDARSFRIVFQSVPRPPGWCVAGGVFDQIQDRCAKPHTNSKHVFRRYLGARIDGSRLKASSW